MTKEEENDNVMIPPRPKEVTRTLTLEEPSPSLFSNITILNNNNTNATTPSMSYFQDGSSVAIWQQFTGENNITLVAQVYNSNNAKIGNNTYVAYSPVFGSTKLKTFQDGSYVVVYSTLATMLSDYRIYAQYFNATYHSTGRPILLMNSTRYNQGIFDIDVTNSSLIIATMTDKKTLTTKKFNNNQQEPIYTTQTSACITQLVNIEIDVSPIQDSAVLSWSPLNDQGIFTQRYNTTDGSEIGTQSNIPSIPIFFMTKFFVNGYYAISWQESYGCDQQTEMASFVQIMDNIGNPFGNETQLSGQNQNESLMLLQSVEPLDDQFYLAMLTSYNYNFTDNTTSTVVTTIILDMNGAVFMINTTIMDGFIPAISTQMMVYNPHMYGLGWHWPHWVKVVVGVVVAVAATTACFTSGPVSNILAGAAASTALTTMAAGPTGGLTAPVLNGAGVAVKAVGCLAVGAIAGYGTYKVLDHFFPDPTPAPSYPFLQWDTSLLPSDSTYSTTPSYTITTPTNNYSVTIAGSGGNNCGLKLTKKESSEILLYLKMTQTGAYRSVATIVNSYLKYMDHVFISIRGLAQAPRNTIVTPKLLFSLQLCKDKKAICSNGEEYGPIRVASTPLSFISLENLLSQACNNPLIYGCKFDRNAARKVISSFDAQSVAAYNILVLLGGGGDLHAGNIGVDKNTQRQFFHQDLDNSFQWMKPSTTGGCYTGNDAVYNIIDVPLNIYKAWLIVDANIVMPTEKGSSSQIIYGSLGIQLQQTMSWCNMVIAVDTQYGMCGATLNQCSTNLYNQLLDGHTQDQTCPQNSDAWCCFQYEVLNNIDNLIKSQDWQDVNSASRNADLLALQLVNLFSNDECYIEQENSCDKYNEYVENEITSAFGALALWKSQLY